MVNNVNDVLKAISITQYVKVWELRIKIFFKKKCFNVLHIFTDCKCNERGSVSKSCDAHTGSCTCKPHIVGAKCDQCDEGYYGWSWPDCQCNYFFTNIFST